MLACLSNILCLFVSLASSHLPHGFTQSLFIQSKIDRFTNTDSRQIDSVETFL